MSFLQFQVLFFVFRNAQVFGQQRDLGLQTFEAVVQLRFVFFLLYIDFLPFGLLQQRHRRVRLTWRELAVPRTRNWVYDCAAVVLNALLRLQEYFVVHPSLNDQQTSCDERLFEQLSLEHLH